MCKYTLMSYLYVKEGGTKDQTTIDHIHKRNAEGNFILDSGAFTFMERGKSPDMGKYIDGYVGFINDHCIRRFIEMDIDSVAGYGKVLEYRRLIEAKTQRAVIPVFHKSRGVPEFKAMCRDYKDVAFGGFLNGEFPSRDDPKIKALVAYARSEGCVVHGLGCTKPNAVDYGFHSVDSSSWTMARRFGNLHYFTGTGIKSIRPPAGKRMPDSTLYNAHNFAEWCKYQEYMEAR